MQSVITSVRVDALILGVMTRIAIISWSDESGLRVEMLDNSSESGPFIQELLNAGALSEDLSATLYPEDGEAYLSALLRQRNSYVHFVDVSPADEKATDAVRDEQTVESVRKAFVEGKLIVPVVSAEVDPEAGVEVVFATMPIAERFHVMAFTSADELNSAIDEELSWVTLSAPVVQYLQSTGRPIIVNPATSAVVIETRTDATGPAA